jgi:hypothetical protein
MCCLFGCIELIWCLCGGQLPGPDADDAKYGLGGARSLAAWEQHIGITFSTLAITGAAHLSLDCFCASEGAVWWQRGSLLCVAMYRTRKVWWFGSQECTVRRHYHVRSPDGCGRNPGPTRRCHTRLSSRSVSAQSGCRLLQTLCLPRQKTQRSFGQTDSCLSARLVSRSLTRTALQFMPLPLFFFSSFLYELLEVCSNPPPNFNEEREAK